MTLSKKNNLGLQAGTRQEKLLTIQNYSTKLFLKEDFGSSNYFTIPKGSINSWLNNYKMKKNGGGGHG